MLVQVVRRRGTKISQELIVAHDRKDLPSTLTNQAGTGKKPHLTLVRQSLDTLEGHALAEIVFSKKGA